MKNLTPFSQPCNFKFTQSGYLLFCLLTLLIVSPAGSSAQQNDIDLERIQRATVFIIQAQSPDLTTTCVGSGTIVSYDGLILTSAHNVVPNADCPGDVLLISMTITPGEAPVPRYRAEIADFNAGQDLALLRITREFDGRLIEPGTLPVLPFVETSLETNRDETINIIGYPALSSEPAINVTGTITGFVSEPINSEKAWIKITTLDTVPGIVSGGGAYNTQGQLIGVPTATFSGTDSTSCRVIEDTNNDGFINNNDTCVPVEDAIAILRPVSFARPLIRQASLGLDVTTLTVPDFQVQAQGDPEFSRLFFAPSVVDRLPSSVIGSAPAGIDTLYLFFDYSNMNAETLYEMRVNIAGTPSESLSLPPVRWSGGTNGLWYIGLSEQNYANGDYEFRLLIDGIVVASIGLTVGGASMPQPDFTNLAFGLLDEAGNTLEGNGYVIPAGETATARFIYQNMQPGIIWVVVWSFNGNPITAAEAKAWSADDGSSGVYPVSLSPVGGLQPGIFRVDLYIQSPGDLPDAPPKLTATGEFVVAGEQQGALPEIFTNIRFVRAENVNQIIRANPASTYPDGADTLFMLFNWQKIVPGTPWTLRWRIDDEIFSERTVPWSSPESGTDFIARLTAPDGLPDGTYSVELLINGLLMARSEVSVGIGQLPIDELAQSGGLTLRGQIVDSETGQGIDSATFILISEDFSVEDFTWDTSQIYALAISDRNGFFEIDRLLQFEAPYSAIVTVDGYLPVSADGLEYTSEDDNPLEMYIPLVKD